MIKAYYCTLYQITFSHFFLNASFSSWSYSANVWARTTASFRGTQVKFLLETFSPQLRKLHFDFDYDYKEKEVSYALAFGLNEKFLIYNSRSSQDTGLFEGKSELKTNFEFFGGETIVNDYKIKYNMDLSEPFILQYKVKKSQQLTFKLPFIAFPFFRL